MADHITLEPAEGTWTVRAGGAVLGETDEAVILREGDYPPVTYFPRDSIAMAFLDKTDKVTTCPHKGEAAHFSIQTKSVTIENAAWSYEEPKEEMAQIARHLAFYPSDRVVIEEI